jgi:hypothetical protein
MNVELLPVELPAGAMGLCEAPLAGAVAAADGSEAL